jgi:hypothetical protein
VVIVHYDTAGMLQSCLQAVCSIEAGLIQRVIVVDNGSSDRVVERIVGGFPAVELRRNRRNVGFAAACNDGIAAGASPYCLLLNPDVRIEQKALLTLLDCIVKQPKMGIVAPRLVNPDGSLQWSCRRYPTLRAVLLRGLRLDALIPGPVDRYLMRDWEHGHAREVDWVIGACLLVRRAALEDVGPFDEGFFLYCEDTDLCRRMHLAGWSVLYEPAAVVPHEHRRMSARLVPGRAQAAHLRSLVRLFRKHRFPLW